MTKKLNCIGNITLDFIEPGERGYPATWDEPAEPDIPPQGCFTFKVDLGAAIRELFADFIETDGGVIELSNEGILKANFLVFSNAGEWEE